MKIFLLDNTDKLECSLNKQIQKSDKRRFIRWFFNRRKQGGNHSSELTIYTVGPEHYGNNTIIDDFFDAILKDNTWNAICSDEEPNNLMSLTKDTSDSLFLINVDLKVTQKSSMQNQDGVELLKHLRLTRNLCKARNLHIALCSMRTQIELLKSKPGNLIMLSKGVSFHHLPGCLPGWTRDKLSALTEQKANVDQKDFQRFVQCDYQQPDSAHQFSNWWGLLQIMNSRKKLKLPEINNRSAILDENLAKLENKKALFLNSQADSINAENTDTETLNNLRRSIPQNSQIIYLDDEKEWEETLSNALKLDLIGIDVVSRHVTKSDSIGNKFVKTIVPQDTNVSLILIDLRLRGNTEMDVTVDSVSGIKVARILRKTHPGLPIVLVTASNKAITFEAAMRNGIDGYWMKEGIGEHTPQSSGSENYIKLLELIAKMHTPGYGFLRLFSQKISELKNTPQHWWMDHTWENRDNTIMEGTRVFDILDGNVILLREYLRLFHLNHGYSGENDAIQKNWINALIVEAVKVLELIHCLELAREKAVRKDKINMARLTAAREDGWGSQINFKRAKSAHATNHRHQHDFLSARQVLKGVIKYLETKPDERQMHKKYNSKEHAMEDRTDLWEDTKNFMN